jgi:ribonuclease Z
MPYGGKKMGEILILGASNAVPTKNQENTHLLVKTTQRRVLIDCGNNPMQSLQNAGLQPDDLTDLILTHFHPDHVASAPLLIMGLWLTGRTRPLFVHGLKHTIERMEKMMDLYDWRQWPGFYQLQFHDILEEESQLVLEEDDLRVTGSPVRHLLPTMGMRFDFLEIGKSAAISSDTEPSEEMIRLAKNVDVLIHEATGASPGHSSAEQAGEVARLANARSLWLIHYTPGEDTNALINQAGIHFKGPIHVAVDGDKIDINSSTNH